MAMELTPKEIQFADAVASGKSLSDAYRFAYNGSPTVASVGRSAYQMANKANVAAYILERQKEAAAKFRITREWLMNWHYHRATYDPGEIIRTIRGACRHCYGDGHGYQWREPDYMRALAEAVATGDPLPDIGGGFGYSHDRPPCADCPQCDGRGSAQTFIADTADLSPAARMAYEGVKEGRNGIEVKMADKHAAAIELAKLAGMHVEQIKMLNDVPEDAALAALGPVEIAQAYRRLMGTAH